MCKLDLVSLGLDQFGLFLTQWRIFKPFKSEKFLYQVNKPQENSVRTAGILSKPTFHQPPLELRK
jgi:hypothetical protein